MVNKKIFLLLVLFSTYIQAKEPSSEEFKKVANLSKDTQDLEKNMDLMTLTQYALTVGIGYNATNIGYHAVKCYKDMTKIFPSAAHKRRDIIISTAGTAIVVASAATTMIFLKNFLVECKNYMDKYHAK